MNTFPLVVAAPTGRLYDEEAYMVSVRGTEGSLSVLAGHIPFVTALAPGDIRIYSAPGTVSKCGYASGGILTVSPERVTILAADFTWTEQTT